MSEMCMICIYLEPNSSTMLKLKSLLTVPCWNWNLGLPCFMALLCSCTVQINYSCRTRVTENCSLLYVLLVLVSWLKALKLWTSTLNLYNTMHLLNFLLIEWINDFIHLLSQVQIYLRFPLYLGLTYLSWCKKYMENGKMDHTSIFGIILLVSSSLDTNEEGSTWIFFSWKIES